ncbi:unnamed protein product, partial [Effrenium voratum]
AHELPVLCDAFHGRLGEIFSTLPLASLSQAAELLVSLAELADKRMPALKPEAQLNGIIEVRLNYFIHQSTRILDTKVDNSVHKTRLEQGGMLQELDHLLKCYQHAENLAREGIASLKSVKKALEHLLRLVENVPLVDLQHRAGELRSTGESCLEELLLARMRQVSLRNRQQVDCKLVAEALLEIHRKLDLPQLDREVEDTIAWEVPAMVKMWSLDRLQFECETKAGLQILAQASSRVWECANAEVSNRLLGWVCESVSNLRQSRNLDTAQAAILRWKKMTQRAIGSGLVIFAPEARTQTIDMFSRCYDDFVSSRDSSASADEIDRLLFQVAVIMGVDRKGDAEQLRKAEDASFVSCWEKGHSREECCGDSDGCFDSIYTRKECCGTGYARLFPSAEPVDVDWEEAFRWASEASSLHPSFSSSQRAWEASMSNATIRISQEVLGQQLEFVAFKRSGPALGKVLEELSEDLYRLSHVDLSSRQAPVAVDVGASIGLVSVLLCKLWAGARVVALEPAPPNFRYLLWNLRMNGVTGCVWPLNLAAGGFSAAARSFFYSPTYPTWSQHCFEDCKDDDSWRGGFTDWQVRFSVPVASPAEVLFALGLGAVDFLKVDCEGCEWEIFAPHVWERLRHRISNVATELHQWALPADAEEGLEAKVEAFVCKHKVVRENLLCSTM